MKLIIKILVFLALTLSFYGCTGNLKNGQIKHIPCTSNYVITTDSFIYMIDRDSGKILSKIKKH